MKHIPIPPTVCFVLLLCTAAPAVEVADDETLRQALRRAEPGTVIRVAAGAYRGGLWLDRSGTRDRPIVIEAADPKDPPTIEGGDNGIQLSGCSFVTLRHLRFRGQTGNGLNIDDAGRRDGSAEGIVLEGLHVSDVGPTGNHDGIKLSGLTRFRVSGCAVEGWGGSAIDMVGCHEGVTEECRFLGKEGFEQATGPQTKGGSRDITIRRCLFHNAGRRALNIGGSTGRQFFRPPDANYEAKDITVEDCHLIGSEAAVAFVGVDGATFRRNSIERPGKWVMRILQETTDEPFLACRDVVFERNLILFRRADVRTHVNVGPHTLPHTFVFRENAWYCYDEPARSRPDLPAPERDGVYGAHLETILRQGRYGPAPLPVD